jgi:esterase/lipase
MRKLLLLHGAIGSAANFNQLISHLLNDFEIHILTFEGHDGEKYPNMISQ